MCAAIFTQIFPRKAPPFSTGLNIAQGRSLEGTPEGQFIIMQKRFAVSPVFFIKDHLSGTGQEVVGTAPRKTGNVIGGLSLRDIVAIPRGVNGSFPLPQIVVAHWLQRCSSWFRDFRLRDILKYIQPR